MATEFPAAHFTGIDKVYLFPKCIYPENVSFQQMDVTDGLPFQDNTFDFVHLRLFVLAFNETQWDETLKEIYRVTKPGGYVQLMEVDLVVSIVLDSTYLEYQSFVYLIG
jgi:ubiquinone/menaquinone biosynthesis C-methylase UbiE